MEVEQSYSLPHGQKRHPDDDLENEQRLAKRFNLLNLENTNKLYISVRPSTGLRNRSNAVNDSMTLDDTKDRVFIHDLDEELANLTPEEEKLVFLPDIDRELTRLPRSILLGNEPKRKNEVVLYKVPESLSIPQEEDSIRKAMLESRERAREKQLRDHRWKSILEIPPGPSAGLNVHDQLSSGGALQHGNDADAMEIE